MRKRTKEIVRQVVSPVMLVAALGLLLSGCAACNGNTEVSGESVEVTSETTAAETTTAQKTELTESELAFYTKDGTLTGFGSYTIVRGSTYALTDYISGDSKKVKSISIDDSAVKNDKKGTYTAEAEITFADGTVRTAQIPVEVVEKDALTEALLSEKLITGAADISVKTGTALELKDMVFVDSEVIRLIKIDDSKLDLTKEGIYEIECTYLADDAALNEHAEKHVDDDKKNICTIKAVETDYEAVTFTFIVTVVSEKQAAASADVITDDTIAQVISGNKEENAGTNAQSGTQNEAQTAESGTQAQTQQETQKQVQSTTAATQASTQAATERQTQAATTATERQTQAATTATQPATQAPTQASTTQATQPATTQPTTVHTHSYSVASSTSATCTQAGSVVYSCSCGDSYTETVPATGHNWKPHYTTVHHDAVYDDKWVVDFDAWTEPAKYEVHAVCDCGLDFDAAGMSAAEIGTHCEAHALAGESDGWSTKRVMVSPEVYHEEEGHWEKVVVSAAWDEDVVDYYYCANTNCGATK